ncbi:hypothetical protein DXG01_006524 [Tephrocybe rancida]|nr:hypothetical protein DXG01_006524 [Tephrocybe rancida]
MSSSSSPRFQLPGFGLPLNHNPHVLFKNALNGKDVLVGDVQLPFLTLRELSMLNYMNSVTDKPNWYDKIFDESIVEKWKSEAETNPTPAGFTDNMFAWCIAELRYKAKIFSETGIISVFNGDVVKSDTAVPFALQEALKAAVASLERVPDRQKDWHPGSNKQVLDLVHPSLFPLIYGRSKILGNSLVGLDNCIRCSGEGTVVPVPPEKDATLDTRVFQTDPLKKPYSMRFQWLPCEVGLSKGASSVKITSYINNLHPEKHADLYAVIEQLIGHTIPLWNATLTPLKAPRLRFNRVPYEVCVYDPDPENWDESELPEAESDEDEDDYNERLEEFYEATRVVVQPDAGTFILPSVPPKYDSEYFEPETRELKSEKKVNLFKDYGERGLQVIVKLANIVLTPENPTYGGGTWHVEGQLNEHICASAIYYYDSKNITTSRLAFRQQSQTDEPTLVRYLQNHHDWIEPVYGCSNDGPAVQVVGAVDTPEGRLLTWPNVLQHQVQPFELVDHSQPGHRKIVALFLVDPNIQITSTANVPCQQREWWSEAVKEAKGPIGTLPLELQDKVVSSVENFPISLEEAKALRVQLMDERKEYVVEHEQSFMRHKFSLCEH